MLGTHNSMSYLPPKHWWQRIINFTAKCQNLTLEEQYNKGVRLFDIRIGYDKNGVMEFRHGPISYKGDAIRIIEDLNNFGEPVKVRIVLEISKPNKKQEKLFKLDVCLMRELFTNIMFYEGVRKCDWKQLVELPFINVYQPIGSMQKNKLWGIWPWLYAKLHNKYIIDSIKFILMDFIK